MKKETEITISGIKRIHHLLSVADNTKNIHVSDIAKEMGVKKTLLMEFILNKNNCFDSSSDKKGFFIKKVYLSPSENPRNIEWLERVKNELENTLFVIQWDCYGCKEEYFLPQDKNSVDHEKYDSIYPFDRQTWKWRNTYAKMEKVKASGHFHEGFGSIDTFNGRKIPYCLSEKEMVALIDDGWTLMGELPKSIEEYQEEKENERNQKRFKL